MKKIFKYNLLILLGINFIFMGLYCNTASVNADTEITIKEPDKEDESSKDEEIKEDNKEIDDEETDTKETMKVAFTISDRKKRIVKLKWNLVNQATVYRISQYIDKKWEPIQITKFTSDYIVLKTTGKEYQYRVEALNEEETVIGISKNIKIGIPKKISSVNTTGISNTKVHLYWKTSSCVSYYEVYRRLEKDKYKYIGKTKKYEFTDKVKKDSTYSYKITPVYSNAAGQGKGEYATISYKNKDFVSTNHQKYNYNEMVDDIKELKAKYSEYVDISVIGKSEQKRNIYDVIIGNKKAKKCILVVNAIHAREYATTVISMKQAEYYLQNYNKKIDGKKPADAFNDCSIHYIMMANPDGVHISQNSNPLWKNNGNGVNLNNNFPYNFMVRGKKRTIIFQDVVRQVRVKQKH